MRRATLGIILLASVLALGDARAAGVLYLDDTIAVEARTPGSRLSANSIRATVGDDGASGDATVFTRSSVLASPFTIQPAGRVHITVDVLAFDSAGATSATIRIGNSVHVWNGSTWSMDAPATITADTPITFAINGNRGAAAAALLIVIHESDGAALRLPVTVSIV